MSLKSSLVTIAFLLKQVVASLGESKTIDNCTHNFREKVQVFRLPKLDFICPNPVIK